MRTVRLDELVSFQSGNAWKAAKFNTESDGLPVIRIQNVDAVRESDFKYWNYKYDDKYLITEGDLLLTLSGSFRVSQWSGPIALLNQRIVKLTPKDGIHLRWLTQALTSLLVEVEKMGRHSLVNNVALSDLKQMKLALPPLAEQKRIAAILDQADALRRQRQRALDRLNQLGQSIFYDMFGDRNLDGKWKFPETELMNSCHKITDGTHQSPKWENSGVPFLFSSNIRHQRISYETKKFISEETYAELTKHSPVEENDVLYTAVGSFGHSAVVDGKTKFLFQRHIAQLKPDFEKLNSTFLSNFLESVAIKRHAERMAKGVAQKTVTLTEIKKFPLPIVPLETQLEFERRVSSLESAQEGMETHLSHLNVCFASLQQRAFRGEL